MIASVALLAPLLVLTAYVYFSPGSRGNQGLIRGWVSLLFSAASMYCVYTVQDSHEHRSLLIGLQASLLVVAFGADRLIQKRLVD